MTGVDRQVDSVGVEAVAGPGRQRMVPDAVGIEGRHRLDRRAVRDQAAARALRQGSHLGQRHALVAAEDALVFEPEAVRRHVPLRGHELEDLAPQIRGGGDAGIPDRERRAAALRTVVVGRGVRVDVGRR